MKRNFGRVLFVLLVFCLVLGTAVGATIILPLEQVKPGMKGIGRTVFEGTKIEEFEAEILGVLPNFQPHKNLILARLKGRGLETTGVISGMSGSPVYIDGKLIGAIAYSFSFAKEAVAGITPIGEMLSIPESGGAAPSSLLPQLALKERVSVADLLEVAKTLWPQGDGSSSGGGSSVLSDRRAARLQRLFRACL